MSTNKKADGEEYPVISRYTDQDAIEDGLLIDISTLRLYLAGRPVNRMTRNFWEKLKPFVVNELDPLDKPMLTLKRVLKTKIKMARITPDNPDGYMYILPPNLWAVFNEVEGYTLMLPEDY